MSSLAQLKLLVNLATIDGEVAEQEKKYITNIGLANGQSRQDIDHLMGQQHEVIIPEGLSKDQKFDYLFSLVQLMKIDERLYKNEIKFCAQVASKLGYQPDVMVELMLKVSSFMHEVEIDRLRSLVEGYLVK